MQGFAGLTARNIIDHNPNYAGGYYAMALIAEHAKDSVAESQLLAAAEKHWSKADFDLADLVILREKCRVRHDRRNN